MSARDDVLSRERLIASRLERWFSISQRPLPWRKEYRPYHIWVSEVMLQQTRMEVVLQYFEKFVNRFPNITALANATLDDVLTAWSGLGYYRRARMLHQGAQMVRERFHSRLPRDLATLTSIPGIGRYTAGAIASVSFDLPHPIVDGNVARLLARIDGLYDAFGTSALSTAEWSLAERLVASSESPRAFNQAMMEVGALICRPSAPECPACPVRDLCVAYATNAVDLLPVKAPRAGVRTMQIPLYLIRDASGAILMRREVEGSLMSGMFHLPHGSRELLDAASLQVIASTSSLGVFRHTVTNRRIEFLVVSAGLATDSVSETAEEYVWIDPRHVSDIPHPSYVRKALEMAGLLKKRS